MADVDEVLSGLNEPQREAVTHKDGPMLVLAGAGSGKTRVVTRRIAWLLAHDVKPSEILALTFTNKAAGEMAERVRKLVGVSRVLVSTFHSFCARMLRRYAPLLGFTSSYTIYDTDDRQRLIKEVLQGLELDTTHFRPSAIEAAISLAKNRMEPPQLYAERNTDFFGENAARVYKRYEEHLRQNNAMDFDDLLLKMVILLSEHETVRLELASRFRYVLVDEYQDTNHAQYRIVQAVTADHRNLHVTGDPDQSIYGWRGADINNILSFERDYPDARVVRLEQNYRSTQVILDAAHGVIRHNAQRKEKSLWSQRKDGPRLAVECLDDERAEADWVAQTIGQLANQKVPLSEIAVFFRTNALSRAIEKSFLEHKIAYRLVAATAFYERKEIRDALGYLKVLVNPSDDVSLARVINVPTRGIGKNTLDALRRFADANRLSLYEACRRVGEVEALAARAVGLVETFIGMMDELRGGLDDPVDAFLKQVLERTGYLVSLEGDPKGSDRMENVQELVNAAGVLLAAQPDATAVDFLEQAALVSDVDALDEARPTVSLMTLHSAKGLEFRAVFMVAMEEGILPHHLSRDGDHELEEERRLCFVGMTRTKERLFLSYTRSRFHFGERQPSKSSRFLDEIPPGCVEKTVAVVGATSWGSLSTMPERGEEEELTTGDRVLHAVYGVGRVESVSGSGPKARIRVKFPAGVKTFVLEYGGLAKV